MKRRYQDKGGPDVIVALRVPRALHDTLANVAATQRRSIRAQALVLLESALTRDGDVALAAAIGSLRRKRR